MLTSKSLGSKFDSLVQNIDSKTHPLEEVQSFIKDQLQDLRSEMAKFDEVVKENREAQESNNILKKQLRDEQQSVQQLNAQIDTLRQRAEDIATRKVELEHELTELSNKARDHAAGSWASEQETTQLRKDLRKAEEDRGAQLAEIERVNENMKKCDKKLEDLKASAVYQLELHL
jgi:chromosome segregation ATPase